MKTLQLGMGWFPEQAGGLNRFYYDCLNYLPKAGVNFQGLVAGSLAVEQSSQGSVNAFAECDTSLFKRWLGVRQNFRQYLIQKDCDLVVSHFALYTTPILNLLSNYPLVMHFQGPWALEGKMEGGKSLSIHLKKMLEQLTYNRVSQFIVLSDAFKQVLHQQYAVPQDKIHVIPAGVDTARFQLDISATDARVKLGWPTDRPIIFAARRLAKRMGLENLIEAMDTAQKHYPDAMLYVAGKGAQKTALEQQIQLRGLSDNVKLLGFISDEDLLLAYRAADFSVVPTVAYEGFGLIVIESLAMGTPVLGTPIDAIPEILGPLSPDTLFDSPQSQHLASGIIDVLSGVRQLPDAATCQKYVADNYDWSVVSQRIKSVYQLALDEVNS